MIKCHFVDVKSISSKLPRSNFNEAELEILADAILSTNGLLRPLVLEPTGAETYQVIAGDREYYAAVVAKEKDIEKAEMVNAFVIDPNNRAAALTQLDLLTSSQTLPNVDLLLTSISTLLTQQLQPVLTQLERHERVLSKLAPTEQLIESVPEPEPEIIKPAPTPVAETTEPKQLKEPKTPKTRTSKKIAAKSKQPEATSAINQSLEPSISEVKLAKSQPPEPTIAAHKTTKTRSTTPKTTKTKSTVAKQIKSVEIVIEAQTEQPRTIANPLATVDPIKAIKTLDLIDRLDEDMLMRRMKQSGIPKAEQLVPKIIAQRERQPNGKFDSWQQIAAAKISGLGEATIIKIIDKLK